MHTDTGHQERCQPTRLNRFLLREQTRTHYGDRRCINATWPTRPRAVLSLSKPRKVAADRGEACCLSLWGTIRSRAACLSFPRRRRALWIWGPESLTPAGTQHSTLTRWLRLRFVCERLCVSPIAPVRVCARGCKTLWLNLSPCCLERLLSWRRRKQEPVRNGASQARP